MQDYLIPGRDHLAGYPGFSLIGRDAELEKLTAILGRKFSSSVLLVAPSGAGATSMCLGLQALKADRNAPFDIVSKTLYWLDTDSLFATGDAQAIDRAFRLALDRIKRSVEPILIIEDAGDFLDACRTSGASHFVNLINGAVRDGAMQVIFETNYEAIDKMMKWHSDIRENYTILDIGEPAGEDLLAIVESASGKIADFHKIRISPEAIRTAVELTEKYRAVSHMNAAQPKRSIGLLDRALSAYGQAAHRMPPRAMAIQRRISAGQADAAEIAEFGRIMEIHAARQDQLRKCHIEQREAEAAILKIEADIQGLLDAAREKGEQAQPETRPIQENPLLALGRSGVGAAGGFGGSELARLQDRLSEYNKALKAHIAAYQQIADDMNAELELGRAEVMHEFSRISGISVSKLGEDDLLILRNLEPALKAKVFGQDRAVEQMSNAIRVARVGRRNKNRPQASFLLLGPSGVGKTEIAKQISAALLGDVKALTRFDMSEYMERHAVAKLIGAPPGYEGFAAGGILTNAMLSNRNRIILFDEIEKAHPDVFNLFLQILDDGRLTDNIGRTVDFSESIIIMTTNIGQPHFLNKELDYAGQMADAMRDLDGTYRPEFLNRFNGRENIIGFKALELSTIELIVRREINDMAAAYQESHGIEIRMPDAEISRLCADRYDPVVGARGLPGFINVGLEPIVVNAILDRQGQPMDRFDVGYDPDRRGFVIGGMEMAAA